MSNEETRSSVINILQHLGVFTYEEFQKCLQNIPDSNFKFEYIQSIFDSALLSQSFEYYIYVG